MDSSGTPRGGALRRLGTWCARHFLVVIVGWLVALVALQVLSRTYGGTYSDDFSLPGVQSQQGLDVLRKHDPQAGGYGSQIVLHDSGQPLTALGSQMSTTVADLQKLPYVLSVQNPLTQTSSKVGPVSGDGRTAYLTVRFDVQPATLGDDYLDGVDRAVQPLRAAGADVEYGGPLGELARPAPDDRISELIGFAVAVVVLLVGFGSVIAAGLPLLTALIGVVGGRAGRGQRAAAHTIAPR
ncbi:MMPL family transporter, partial [Streptomyces sp. NPDC057052]|uniref:MMPL family transporter n=1 Tax=Streptomyces sp. NPDC057052 TaxID=3346010 RepID=UPI003634489B